jgi:tRNA A37 methylthiotransferase MiaB
MLCSKNVFGNGTIYNIDDVQGKIYCVCTACMSVWADFLSWANAHKFRMVFTPQDADNIIVLSCQVTDLAIYNDLQTLWALQKQYPTKQFYIGGCLAYRFDIELGDNIKRLSNTHVDGQFLFDNQLVKYIEPFWSNKNGNAGILFRQAYPLRIGVGCSRKCSYCTIRHTRAPCYNLDANVDELVYAHKIWPRRNIVLIADNPTVVQLSKWLVTAEKENIPISLRNIEPSTAVELWKEIKILSSESLLSVFHCPIQSCDVKILENMNRDVANTLYIYNHIYQLAAHTTCATNIIVDYMDFNNNWTLDVYDRFHYVSWNPYWDNKWDLDKARLRWRRYFGA